MGSSRVLVVAVLTEPLSVVYSTVTDASSGCYEALAKIHSSRSLRVLAAG